MNLKTARVKIEEQELLYRKSSYANNPIKKETNSVVEGSFYQVKPLTVKEMVIRKINKTLCFCLGIAIVATFVSYYIAMNYEAKLNALDIEIVRLNAENQDLQAELDRFKSFNNVDNKIGEFKLLQKANKVIEVTALNSTQKNIEQESKTATNNFNWAIGY
ncbi:MAG: hypothetical protein E7Z87_04770 [Cyanobacteria bacterium SIG26]|nr:hypothetical protein [Cyanobacteria bacterium SIG26]